MARYDFGFKTRPSLRLARVEQILRDTRIVDPVPSRKQLIRLIESGTLAGRIHGKSYIVYEDSFKAWVKSFHPEDYVLRS